MDCRNRRPMEDAFWSYQWDALVFFVLKGKLYSKGHCQLIWSNSDSIVTCGVIVCDDCEEPMITV